MTLVKAYSTELDADHTITVVSVPDYLASMTPVEYRIPDVNVGADTLRVELYTAHDYYNYVELTGAQGVKAYYFATPEQVTPVTVAYVLTRDYWHDVTYTAIHGNLTRSHLLPLVDNYFILPIAPTPREIVYASPIHTHNDIYFYFCSVSVFVDGVIIQRGVGVPYEVSGIGENPISGLRVIAGLKTLSGSNVMSVNAVWLVPRGLVGDIAANTAATFGHGFSGEGQPVQLSVYSGVTNYHKNGTINPWRVVDGVPVINTLYVGNFGNMIQLPFEGNEETHVIFDCAIDWDAGTVSARAVIGEVQLDLTPTMTVNTPLIKRNITDEAAAAETTMSGISAVISTVGGLVTLNPMAIAGGIMAGAATISNALTRETARQEGHASGNALYNYKVRKEFYDITGTFQTSLNVGLFGIIEMSNSNARAIDAELDARGFTGVYNHNNYLMGNYGLAINGKNAYGAYVQITDAHVERVGVNAKRAELIESVLQRGTTIYSDYAHVGSKIDHKKYLV